MGLLVEDLLQLARLDQEQTDRARTTSTSPKSPPTRLPTPAPSSPTGRSSVSVVPAVVHGNEPALRQVVANLLANVRAHTPDDARRRRSP